VPVSLLPAVLTYVSGGSLAHRFDARTKLLFQLAFATAAFAHTTPRGLVILAPIAGGVLLIAETPPVAALRDLRLPVLLLAAGPVLEGLRLGPPWFDVDAAYGPVLAGIRVLLILLVSAAYVRTTPVRETRAAIQRTVPGRPGAVLGVGIAIVFRFFPVLLDDLTRSREAIRARLGEERPLRERMQIVATAGLRRAFKRADHLALALQSRCLAWNPTLPELAFGRRDVVGVAAAISLTAWAVAPLILG
jgi:biotin transport system permease protein